MIQRAVIVGVIITYAFLLSGCGSSSKKQDQDEVIPVPPSNTNYTVESKSQASAFLSRATFGAASDEINSLVDLDSYEKWIENQFKQKPSYHINWAENHAKGIDGVGDLKNNPEDWRKYSDGLGYLQRDAWWDIAVNGKDQLRQRVAFALSEIMVISKNGSLINMPDSRMSYYDVLVKHALGNFENLLQDVTYHPAMGRYLSYLGNAKADPTKGNHPDENYAREVMQLFTIGLYQLNMDGTKKLNNGKTLPSYNQNDIREMAKVFTGLSDDNSQFPVEASFSSNKARTTPMAAFEEYHDSSEKQFFLGKEIILAGGNAKTDIDKALHILFMHSNTAPFISKQLIQRLVTSNPSPKYVQRVASAFNDNGKGARGDMQAVIKAILLDEEALNGVKSRPNVFGKFREPLLFVSHLFRAFKAQNASNSLQQGDKKLYQYHSFNFNGTGYTTQEGALEALTVFNYFTPEDAPYSLKKEKLVAPELELYGTAGLHSLLMGLINKDGFIYQVYEVTAELQLDAEKALVKVKKYDALLDHLDIVLTGGNMSNETKGVIKQYILDHANDADINDEKLVRYTIGLVMTSPDYALQR